MSAKNLKDLTSQRFGRWKVLGRLEPKKAWPKPRWIVQCDCGTVSSVYGSPLVGGKSSSCGCGPVGRHPSHGMDGTPEYRAWHAMWSRCTNPRNSSYARYGARGIRVDPEWGDFTTFIRDIGMRPSRLHSLDREKNNGDYSKSNCRWATPDEQANNRSSNRALTAFGETMNLCEWSRKVGIRADTVAYRIDKWGWTPEKALTVKPSKSSVERQQYEKDTCNL